VTHRELGETVKALAAETLAFCQRCNATPVHTLSVIGSNAVRLI